jgi:hypothetical protein
MPVPEFWRMVGEEIELAQRPLAQKILNQSMGIGYRQRNGLNFFDITQFVEAGAAA